MEPTGRSTTRVIASGAAVLTLALGALGVAAWALTEKAEADAGSRARSVARVAAEDLLRALARAQPGPTLARFDAALSVVDPPPPLPLTPTPPPVDAEAAFFVRAARLGGGDVAPRIALRTALRSEDPSVRLRAAAEGARLELRERTGREADWIGAPPAASLARTREALFLALVGGGEPAVDAALAAIGSRDEDEAAALLLTALPAEDVIRRVRERRTRLAEARQVAESLRAAERPTGADPGLVTLSADRSALVAREAEGGAGWTAHRLSADTVAGIAARLLPERGLALVLGAAPDAHPLPGGAWSVARVAGADASSSGVLVGGLLVAGLAAVAAFLAFVRGVTREARLSALRAEFVSTVGHELRTPVAVIRTCAETLALGRATREEDRQQFLDAVLRESERLTGVLGNVLDFARLEAGRRTFELVEADVAQVVTRTVEDYRGALARLGFDVALEVAADLPPVRCDAEALAHALTNLLENAAKYSPERRDAVVRVRGGAAEVVIEVVDHGVGVPDGERQRIFERFYRGTGAAVRETRGAGIGLALVHHAARAHGGRIEVRDTPGGGATFALVLPVRRKETA